MSLSILSYFYKLPEKFAHFWLYVIGVIFFSLSIAGFSEADYLDLDIIPMWWVRLAGGVFAVLGLLYYIVKTFTYTRFSLLQLYHLNGFASDGIGGLVLFLFGPLIFGLLGFEFTSYYYLVFGFMGFVGIIHLIGVSTESYLLAWLTAIARLITGTVFLALFYAGKIDALALLVGFYDIAYALLYLLTRRSA
jgi:hypothetical protein